MSTPSTEQEWIIHSINIHGVFFERSCQEIIAKNGLWKVKAVNFPVEYPPPSGPLRGKESALDICQGPPNVIALGPGKGIAGFGAAAVGWVGGSAQRPWDRAMRSRGALRGGLLCWVLGGLSFGGALGAVGRAVHDDDVGVVQQAVHGGGSEQSVAEEGAPLGGGAI